MTFSAFNCLAAKAGVVVLPSGLFLLERRAVALEVTGFLAVVALGSKEGRTDHLSSRPGGVTYVVAGEDDFRLASVEADLAEHLVGADLASRTVARVTRVTRLMRVGVTVGDVKSESGHFLIECLLVGFGFESLELKRVFDVG